MMTSDAAKTSNEICHGENKMIVAISNDVANRGRIMDKSHDGDVRWYTWLIGKRRPQSIENHPRGHMTEMDANQTILLHYHRTDQFQVFGEGSVSVAGKQIPLIALHYSDHHTPFGPLTSGPFGLRVFALMPQTDPVGIYAHQSGYEEQMKLSKRRSLLVPNIILSTVSVLEHRRTVAFDSLFEKDVDTSDGLGAYMLRMGADMKTTGPDPKVTGGQGYLVLKGSLHYIGASYPAWSTLYADASEGPLEISAGARGLEAIVMNFPRRGE
jgi:hypothetical protein